jgi:hypothetical protein
MDIEIPLVIKGVPDAETATAICDSIQRVLMDEHGTDMWVAWDSYSEDFGDGTDDEPVYRNRSCLSCDYAAEGKWDGANSVPHTCGL